MPSVQPTPPRRRARARLAAATALTAALLAGCSGPFGAADSEPSVAPAPEATSVVVAPDAVVPESDGGSVEAPASPSPEESEPAEPPAGSEVTGECSALQAAWSATNQALVNLSPDHPRAFVDSFRVAAESMASVTAPDAVADDWAAMADYLSRVNAAFADVDVTDAAAVQTALAGAVSAEDLQRATTAQSRITVFVSADCQAG
ncbi:hypothetical protein [Xylanimonas protaetiae]|uniref:hypothetical protein n=1 Tax=Xylanimonas protaetiae TaxID=2509457 RepID=UPI0013EC28E1|nr:hypothetical protein [Xylanimonas protaetiae]